jgi:two-component system, NtrC family, response regulator HydG
LLDKLVATDGLQADEPIRPEATRMRALGFIGTSPMMRRLYEDLEMIAPTEATVLIQGESGTGKGLAAQALHQLSRRSNQPLLRVNCGAITETLLESELFGIEKNVATGVDGRKGIFELADRGTVFLDEVGDMSPKLQVKLLHVLQDRRFMKVGGARGMEVDVRVIAATNKDLYQLVTEDIFREDLYYRLNVVSIAMPPLRERPEDIPLLLEHFLAESIRKNRKPLKGFSKEALHLMYSYPWPGNVRELENAIERGVILARHEKIMPEDLPLTLRQGVSAETTDGEHLPSFSIKRLERDAIIKVLRITGGNRTEAAKLLGISRRTLQYKLKEYSIEDEETLGG